MNMSSDEPRKIKNQIVLPSIMAALVILAFGAVSMSDDVARLVIDAHPGGVTCVSFSPDSTMIASGGFDGVVRMWNTGSGKIIRQLGGNQKEVLAVAFSSDGSMFAASGFDGTVKVWDVKSGALVRTHTFESYSAAIDISSRGFLAVGLQDGTMHIFEMSTGELIKELDVQWPVYSIAYSRDGSLLATAGPIQLWNTETWEQVARPRAPGGVYGLDFAPDGPVLVSAHLRGTAYVWAEQTYEKLREFRVPFSFRGLGPKGFEPMETALPLTSICFSPDGKSVAVAGADKVVRLWSVKTGEIADAFEGHSMSVVGLSFASDGGSVASASLDGTIRLWKIR